MEIFCIKGTWKSPNVFIDDVGTEIIVSTYDYLYKEIDGLYPFQCFINYYNITRESIINQRYRQVISNNVVIGYFPIVDNFKEPSDDDVELSKGSDIDE